MNELVKDWDLTRVQKEVKIIQEHDVFVVVDIETVGFKPVEGKDKMLRGIIEIAALKVQNGTIVDRFHAFVNPEQRIPKKITELTGITDADVKFAPKTNTVLWAFSVFLGDAVAVCHNAAFDWDTWLEPLMKQAMIKVENPYVCTYKTFQRSLPGLGKGAYTNEKMALLFGYWLKDAHRADADVEATAHSLMGLKRWFDKVDMATLIKEKEEAEMAKEDTPVEVESVNFWEKVFGPKKQMKRQYVRIKNKDGEGTVFYDLIQKIWKNKDFPSDLNFRSVERDTLSFLGLNGIQEFEGYRG